MPGSVPITIGIALIAALLGAQARAADLLIRDVRIVDLSRPDSDPVSVVVRDGRIAEIGPAATAQGVPTLEGDGAWLAPGLIDAHVHLSVAPGSEQRGDPPEVAAQLRRWHLPAYLASGVTTVLDTGIDASTAQQIRGLLDDGLPGPRFLTLGPALLTPGGYMADVFPDEVVSSPEEVGALLDANLKLGVAGVKVPLERGFGPRPTWAIHPPEIRRAIAAAAKQRELPLYVHSTSEEEHEMALDMGPTALVHVGYFAAEPSEAFVERLARSGVYVMSTFSIMDSRLVGYEPERLDAPIFQIAVPPLELETARDPAARKALLVAQMEMSAPELPGFMRRLIGWWVMGKGGLGRARDSSIEAARRMFEAGVPLVLGSDSGNWPMVPYQFHGPTTIRELELLAMAGLSPAEILAAATRVAAEMLGLEAELGAVTVGRRADLVLLAADPLADVGAWRSIRYTVRDGVARTPRGWMEAARLPE